MIRTLAALSLVAGLACGASARALPLFDPPADAAKAAEDAAKKAADDAMAAAEKAVKDAMAAAGAGATAAPARPVNPNAIPVPSDLPVVKTTDLTEGLSAEDLKIGEGYEVKDGGTVVAFYHGTLKEGGKVFDSAYERGQPIGFGLNGVIPGWQKGVPGMKVGGIRRLTIPAKLAYGEQSPSPEIPPNSDLVFIIQLTDALQVEDVKVGEGEEVGPRPVCVTVHKLIGPDGKEIENSTAANPFIWVPGEFQGMSMILDGMKVGGKRKIIHLPKELNKTAQGAPGNRPSDVALTGEVELIAVKNLVPPQPRK